MIETPLGKAEVRINDEVLNYSFRETAVPNIVKDKIHQRFEGIVNLENINVDDKILFTIGASNVRFGNDSDEGYVGAICEFSDTKLGFSVEEKMSDFDKYDMFTDSMGIRIIPKKRFSTNLKMVVTWSDIEVSDLDLSFSMDV